MNDNEKIIENVKATMAIEGYFLQDEDIVLLNSFLNNNISESQAIDEIKSKFIK